MHAIGCLLAATLVGGAASVARSELTIHAIDAGHGEAYLLHVDDEKRRLWTAMIDAGNAADKTRILKTLQRAKVRALDAFFLTHAHPNHFGALADLVERIPTRSIYWNGGVFEESGAILSVLDACKSHGADVRIVGTGFKPITPEPLSIEIFHPVSDPSSIHADSMVIRVTYGSRAALFTGDLDPVAQPAVMRAVRDTESPIVMITWPHHGDRLSEEWASWFPAIPCVVVGVAKQQWGGGPAEPLNETLWLRAARTDQLGTFKIVVDNNQLRCPVQ